MLAKYSCLGIDGKTYYVEADTTESCDDIIGRCEQVNDVEIRDVVDEQFLDPTASLDDVLDEILDAGPSEGLDEEAEDDIVKEEDLEVIEVTVMRAEVFIIEAPVGIVQDDISFE